MCEEHVFGLLACRQVQHLLDLVFEAEDAVKKDRTEAIFCKCQELLLNVICSEDSGTIVLDLIFLRMLLNDLEMQRDRVIF